jgi:hypothetical protein
MIDESHSGSAIEGETKALPPSAKIESFRLRFELIIQCECLDIFSSAFGNSEIK